MKISVIIPVYNEEKYINFCIKSLLNRFGKDLYEIIVVDGNPSKNTINKIKDFPIKIVKLLSDKGRGKQLNFGAKIATGDILIFIHVDTILPKNCKKYLIKNLKKDVILSFSLGFYDKKLFFKLLEFFGKIRCFLTNIPYGDQCYIMKKETFLKTGGFPEEDLEDVKFIQKAKEKGIKVIIFNEKVKTSPRKWYKNGFVKTTLRHRLIMINYFLKRFIKKKQDR